MTTGSGAIPSVDAGPEATARTGRVDAAVRWFVHIGLGAHAIALAVVLVTLVPLFDDGDIAITDEGLYSAQAAYLADGSWSAPRPMASVDREGRGDLLRAETIVGDRHIPYSRHALLPLLLAAAYVIAGTTGLILVSTISVWAAAVLTGRLAADIDPRAGPLALWLVGAGCPLVFDAYLVSGHATAAALVAAMFVGLHRVEAAPRPARWWATIVAAGGGAALVRSEAVIVVGVIGLVTVGSALVLRPRRHIVWRRVAGGVAIGAAAVGAHLADEWMVARIGQGPTVTGAGNRFDRRTDLVDSLWNDLLRPWTVGPIEARSSTILAFVAVVLAGLLARVMPRRPLLPVSLLVMAAVASAIQFTEDPLLIGGLLSAFPIVILGWSALPATAWRDPRIVRMAAVIAVSIGGIAATTYGAGGIGQWGGRFYHLLLPIAAVPTVVGLLRFGRSFDGVARSVVAAAVVVLTLSFSLLAVRANVTSRDITRTLREELASAAGWTDGDRTSGAPELTILSTTKPDGTGRIFWREVVAGRPIVSSAGIAELPDTLERAREVGFDDVLVLTNIPVGVPDRVVAATAGDRWRVTGWQPSGVGRFALIRLVAVD